MNAWDEKNGGRYKAKRANERKLKTFAVAKKRQSERAQGKKLVHVELQSLRGECYA